MKLGCDSGKPSRLPPVAGEAHTGSRCFSASAIAASHPPLASMSGPATNTGVRALSSSGASCASAAGSGATRVLTTRLSAWAARSASASWSQSSIGIETNTGPRGGSDAWWIARDRARGTSCARDGSCAHLTYGCGA